MIDCVQTYEHLQDSFYGCKIGENKSFQIDFVNLS